MQKGRLILIPLVVHTGIAVLPLRVYGKPKGNAYRQEDEKVAKIWLYYKILV